MINGWVRAFQNTGTLVRRLDIGEGNYMKELEEDFYILDGVSELQAVILANEAECVAFKESYDRYRYLWRNDLNGTLAEFRGTRTDPTATTPSSTSSTPRSQSTKRCKRRSRT